MSKMCQNFVNQYSLRISLSDCSKTRNNKRIKTILYCFFVIDIKIERLKFILKPIIEGIFSISLFCDIYSLGPFNNMLVLILTWNLCVWSYWWCQIFKLNQKFSNRYCNQFWTIWNYRFEYCINVNYTLDWCYRVLNVSNDKVECQMLVGTYHENYWLVDFELHKGDFFTNIFNSKRIKPI